MIYGEFMKVFLILLIFLSFNSAFAQQKETIITGTVTGSDSKPIPKAQVNLIAVNQFERPLASAEVTKDGAYRIAIDESFKPIPNLAAIFLLDFSGHDYQRQRVPLLVGKPISVKLDVQ